MAEVTLTQAVRDSLLSLQNTTSLIEQTQGRLSSGLRVAAAVDDAVAFFQSKGLSDRAFDFQERKDSIDQGISAVTGALDGVDAIETLVRQLKGIAQSLKSAEASQLSDLVSQFGDLRTQINELAADATYQGTNLINGTGVTLSIAFSQRSASKLDIISVDLTVGTNGLNVNTVSSFTGGIIGQNAAAVGTNTGGVYATNSTALFSGGETVNVTFEGLTTTFSAGSTITFNGATLQAISAVTLNANDVFQVTFTTASNGSGATSAFYVALSTAASTGGNGAVDVSFAATFAASTTGSVGTAITAGETISITYEGLTRTFTTADNGITFSAIGTTATLFLGTGQSLVLSAGKVITLEAASGTTGQVAANQLGISDVKFAGTTFAGHGALTAATTDVAFVQSFGASTGADGSTLIRVGDNASINSIINSLDSALTTLRTKASTLGGNVSVLQTRLDFTKRYVDTLEGGAAKLTLADINEEGANLLALQTRQQLGIQALSFAGQAEQSILALFQ